MSMARVVFIIHRALVSRVVSAALRVRMATTGVQARCGVIRVHDQLCAVLWTPRLSRTRLVQLVVGSTKGLRDV